MDSFTATPWLRASDTVIAATELLWHDTQPDFFMKVTSACCNNGRARPTATRADPAGAYFSVGNGRAVPSTAPAFMSSFVTGVSPRIFAKFNAVIPSDRKSTRLNSSHG